jgi:putative hydroxymethylpyrimidine transport system substrate-binding protein
MRRISAILGIVVMGVALVALAGACYGKDEVTKLALDWYPNSNHAGLYIAQDKGYFSAEELNVNLYTPSDPTTVLKTVGAGQDQFGISYQAEVILARAEGVPVVSVMALVQHPLNSVMALKDSGIARPRDLVGKKVGYPDLPADQAILRTMVEKDGGDFSKVELVNVGFDLVPALVSKRVDAVVGAYWTHENIILEQQGHQVTILKMEEWGVPDFYELVLVTSEKMLRDKPDQVLKMVQAVQKGYNDAFANTDAALQTLFKANPQMDRPLEERGIKLLAPAWKSNVAAYGWQTPERWVTLVEWMQKNGVLAKPVDVDKMFTNGYVEQAAKRQ